jgi:hypothetical protein
MDIEDLHNTEDSFEVFSDHVKAPQVVKENTKVENNGYTSARRVALSREENSLDDKWSKYII